MLPAYYTEISELAEVLAIDEVARVEEVAFLKARLARGTASPQEVARLMNMMMEGE
jgi:hypothetical protein